MHSILGGSPTFRLEKWRETERTGRDSVRPTETHGELEPRAKAVGSQTGNYADACTYNGQDSFGNFADGAGASPPSKSHGVTPARQPPSPSADGRDSPFLVAIGSPALDCAPPFPYTDARCACSPRPRVSKGMVCSRAEATTSPLCTAHGAWRVALPRTFQDRWREGGRGSSFTQGGVYADFYQFPTKQE
ncbi:hypothetical protein POX_h09882 [Penicillium oxalicum]|uniref:Uncharacterized protein n=1 Tax=Penicillium oxalicum (strain 114-2 / CGMCC 5302) TaxID=933388 RepID=S8AYV9_PENO1|nr:hypothetical protein POX_h09882 [Penicillium oxalicum]EPS31608.1 hypothetical protein PDE_06563 [Penicillium oxalicum 114-2]KAI2786115.1 hypothetical protein POX_h09882 [Penicillium oxalicum]